MPSQLQRFGTYAQLTRWLGPWAGDKKPGAVACHLVEIPLRGGRTTRGKLFVPVNRPAIGSYLVAPGLHYLGPADPRFDRFATVLSASGLMILTPWIPDYLNLRVTQRAVDDFEDAFAYLLRRPDRPATKSGVFSISFGSLLALRLASSERFADDVGGVVVFGGYADWRDTILFSLTGEIDGRPHAAHDPLNRPVVFMNLPHMKGYPRKPAALESAWMAYIRDTWGREKYKSGDAHLEVAERHRASVPTRQRGIYDKGTGLAEGGLELVLDALDAAPEKTTLLDPRPHLHRLRAPAHIIHGIDDDVIPYTQLHKLAEAMPANASVETYLTGLYGHTNPENPPSPIAQAPKIAKELATMLRMVRALGDAATSSQDKGGAR